MSTDEHLEHLLNERRALLREVARLDAAIAMQRAHSRTAAALDVTRFQRGGPLSWEEALHEAKVPVTRDVALNS